MVQTLSLVAAVLLGACTGSFLNVVIYRIPAGTFLSGGQRSHCRNCQQLIRWFDNVPILSWLLLRGKCRRCQNPISARYPFVEALTAVCLGWLFFHDVIPPGGLTAETLGGWDVFGPFAFRAWLLAMLIACTFIDIDHRILPDVLTKPTMVIGLVGAVAAPGLVDGFDQPEPPAAPDRFDLFLYSLVGMGTGLALTAAIRSGASKIFGREAMGFGDVKFMGAIGAFVGWEGALMTFFLGSLLGAIYGGLHQWITKEGQIFFGPFLAMGAVITLFFKADILFFLTKTWPAWQAQVSISPWVSVGIAVGASVLLVFIIRRGRRHL